MLSSSATWVLGTQGSYVLASYSVDYIRQIHRPLICQQNLVITLLVYIKFKLMLLLETLYPAAVCGDSTAGADPGGGLWGLETPLQKYIREAKRMMHWYKNTLKCIIS